MRKINTGTMQADKPIAISLFGGTGFIGSHFRSKSVFKPLPIARESRTPLSDQVLYLISTTHNYHVFEDPHKDIDTNLSILVDVLANLKPGYSVFNFVSSWFVYGDTELPAHEEACCHPKGFYSITKRAAEELLVSYCRTFGIDYRILRLCNVYGPGDGGAAAAPGKKNALQFIIDRLQNNEPVDLYHGGHFYRDYLHVDDVVTAIDLVLSQGELNQVYNIGSGEKILFLDLINLARHLTASNSSLRTIEPPPFHQVVQVKDFYMNCDRLKALGFAPRVTLEEGLRSLCQSTP